MTSCDEAPRVYRGGSMAGALRPGDQLLLQPTAFTALRRGDVIVFRTPDGAREIVHRLVARTAAGLHTRGDRAREIDREVVTPDRYLGRVWAVVRGNRQVTIAGGWRGLAAARWGRFTRAGLRFLAMLARPWRTASREARWVAWLSRLPGVRRVRYATGRPDAPVLKLVWRGHVLARRSAADGRWRPGGAA